MQWIKKPCRHLSLLAGMAVVVFTTFMFVQSSTAIAVTHSYEYITSDTTWHAADNPHIIVGYVIVNSSSSGVATLTIEPGCVLKFNTNASLQIGNSWWYDDGARGALNAQGTVANPIIFDARFASWYTIDIYDDSDDAGTIMDHCTVEDVRNGIQCYNASPTIKNSTIRNFLYYGIYCTGSSSPTIQNCTIGPGSAYGYGIYNSGGSPSIQQCTINNTNFGIYTYGSPVIQQCTIGNIDTDGIYIGDGSPDISNNTISDCGNYGINSNTTSSATVISNNACNNNGLYPIVLHPMAVISTGNSGSGNGTDAILINSGQVTSNATWVDQETGFDYVIDGQVYVQSNTSGDVATLTIAPGFTVKFGGSAGIYIGVFYYYAYGEGTLNAVGTSDNPITFTSKQGSPAPGDWYSLNFYDYTHDAGTILDHCNIEYTTYGIQCYNASPTIQNCTIRESSYAGIYTSGEGSTPLISCSDIKDNSNYGVLIDSNSNASIYHCNITGNASYGVYSANTSVDAKSNWWGASDGPGGSGPGSGDAVSGNVVYSSWKGAYYTCASETTAIELASFTAVADDNGNVKLAWDTVTEVDNAGFNIYRSKHKDGEYTKINDSLIASQGDGANGASYSFQDTPGKGAFYYQLEDVDKHGASAIHGPEKVRVRSGEKVARKQ